MLECMKIRRQGTPEITSVFIELAKEAEYVSDSDVDNFEYYSVKLYSAEFSQSSLTAHVLIRHERTCKMFLSSGNILVVRMHS